MLTILLNTAENSQNIDEIGVWYRPFPSVGNRQNRFLHKGASATISGDGSLSANWWMT